MSTQTIDLVHEQLPPKRRLRKRWIVLLGTCSLLLLGWWWLFQETALAIIPLADGSQFQLQKITVGKWHQYSDQSNRLTSWEIGLNRWMAKIGREITARYSPGIRISTPTTSLGLWHFYDWTTRDPESTPHWIVLTDEQGWRTAEDVSPLHNQPNPMSLATGQSSAPRGLIAKMPSASSSFKMELLNSRGVSLGAAQVPCDFPANLVQVWNVAALPVTRRVGSLNVTLTGVQARRLEAGDAPSPYGDALMVTPEFQVTIDGVASEEWIPLVSGVSPMDCPLGALPPESSVEAPLGMTAPLDQCVVSPYESAWKLHLYLVCRNPDHAISPQIVSLSGVSINGGIAPTPPSDSPADGLAKVKLIGAGRPASYRYTGIGEGFIPIVAANSLRHLTKGKLQGTYQSLPVNPGTAVSGSDGQAQPFPLSVSIELDVPRPHIVLSMTGCENRRPIVVVKDPSGQPLEGELFSVQGLFVWLARHPYPEIDLVDVTVLLQAPQYVSFEVVPPKVTPQNQVDPAVGR